MNRYFQEVIEAHQLIQDWLGCGDAPKSVYTSLMARFSRRFSMVTTTGHRLDANMLETFFLAQCGARPELAITIDALQCVAEHAEGAVVSYQERHQWSGAPETLRVASVVFEHDGDKLIWRHLHETWIDDGSASQG